MQLAFQCPHCRQAVAVTPGASRQMMACPLCRGEFWVNPAPGAGAAEEVAAPPVIAARSATALAPAKTAVETSRTGMLPPKNPAPPIPPAAAPARSAPAAKVRAVARFIATQTADSTVKLTADGKLPELNLSETEAKSKEKGARSSNPLLLVGAVAVSFIFSLLLLFVDLESAQSDGDRVHDARRQIERYYANETENLLPYQALLRESQRAYSRGDRTAERTYLRRVLALLRSESTSRYSGITGTPSSDAELERLLSILLSSNSA